MADNMGTWNYEKFVSEATLFSKAAPDAASTQALASITLPARTGATIKRAIVELVIVSMLPQNDLTASLQNDQEIQVKESVSGTYTNAVLLKNNGLKCNPTGSMGISFMGSIDVVSEVSAFNKTYDFQWIDLNVQGDDVSFEVYQILHIWWELDSGVEAKIDIIDQNVDDVLLDTDEMQLKLPTNNIMGSSDKDDHDTDIDAILADTNEMQGKLPTNNIMGSSTKADMDDEINAIKADTDRLFDSSMGAVTDGSFADNLMNKDAGQTFDPATDSLEAIRDRGDAAWAGTGATKEEIADAVWDELLSGHTTAGSAGKTVQDMDSQLDDIEADTQDIQGRLPATLNGGRMRSHIEATDNLGLTTQQKLDVNAEADQALADYDPPTRAEATSDKNEILAEVNANETKIDNMQSDVTDILADTADMQPKVDGIDTRLPADPADQSLVEDKIDQAVDYLDGPDARDHTEIYNAVTAIQNNTRLKTSVPSYMQKPDTGDRAFRWSANLYDDTGNPENPDNNEILVRVFKTDGTPITDTLYQDSGLATPLANPTDTVNFPPASGWRAMKLITTGRFELFYKVTSTADEEPLNIEFGWMEGGVGPIVFPRATIVSDVKGDIEDIQSKVTDILEDTSTTIPDRIDTLESNLKSMPRMRVNAPCEMYVPQVKTSVNKESGIGASDTTIPVLNIEGLPSSGLVKIDSELIKYDGIDSSTNELTGCTRGAYGTVAATHTDNAVVKLAVVHQILLAVFDNEGNMVNADSTPTIEMFNWNHTQTLVPTNMTAFSGYTGLYYYDHIIVEGDTPANFYIRCEATLGGTPMVEDEPVVVIDKPASESVVVSTSGGGTGDYACDQNGWYDGSGTLHPWGDVLEGPVVDAESGAPLDDCYVTFYPVIGGEAIITDRPT
ncbi:MAG: hypothetical protein ACTSX2_00085, partial [Candidatus Thorarchaeota archaeon]